MYPYNPSAKTGSYENTLCGCLSDCGVCCYVFNCYCCALPHTWADVRGESCGCCHLCARGLWIRSNIKQMRGIQPSFCGDCMVYCFCATCALSQDRREFNAIKACGPAQNRSMTQQVQQQQQYYQPPQQPQGYSMPPPGYAPPPQGYAPPPQGYAPQQGYAPPPQGYPQQKDESSSSSSSSSLRR